MAFTGDHIDTAIVEAVGEQLDLLLDNMNPAVGFRVDHVWNKAGDVVSIRIRFFHEISDVELQRMRKGLPAVAEPFKDWADI